MFNSTNSTFNGGQFVNNTGTGNNFTYTAGNTHNGGDFTTNNNNGPVNTVNTGGGANYGPIGGGNVQDNTYNTKQ